MNPIELIKLLMLLGNTGADMARGRVATPSASPRMADPYAAEQQEFARPPAGSELPSAAAPAETPPLDPANPFGQIFEPQGPGPARQPRRPPFPTPGPQSGADDPIFLAWQQGMGLQPAGSRNPYKDLHPLLQQGEEGAYRHRGVMRQFDRSMGAQRPMPPGGPVDFYRALGFPQGYTFPQLRKLGVDTRLSTPDQEP